MSLKICDKCNTTERYKDGKCKFCSKAAALERYYKDPEGSKKRARDWKVKNKERTSFLRKKSWRKDWAFGEHERAEQLLPYVTNCDCCGSSEPRTIRGWDADHDHKTGKFRAFICHPCNIIIGFVEKYNLDKSKQIEDYLNRHKNEN